MDVVFEARAELDVPGETGRQARVLGVWIACLFAAVLLTAYRYPSSGDADERAERMSGFRRERIAIALAFGLALPLLATSAITHRRRRGGGHARGIVVDVTQGGELRLWGRGYGQRVAIGGAELGERLVDVYSGRLGAWRQRRLSIRAKRAIAGSPALLELATPAEPGDDELGLPLVGGEGDCVELARADYLTLLERLREAR